MRLITYNVNSLAQRLPRLRALLAEHAPDVVCLQETKCGPDSFPVEALRAAGYEAVHRSGGRWAGVAILARAGLALDDVRADLADEPDAAEARWIEATIGGSLRVASVYVPNGRALGTPTFEAKLLFLEAMARRAEGLASRPAVIAGDMNVCPANRDVWDVSKVHGATHVTPDERLRLQTVIDAGFVDAYRRVEPEESGFTWWDYRAGHFHKGFGLRIDLTLVSQPLADRLTGARVDRDYRKPTKVRESKPSDHAPLIVDFDGRA